MLQGDNGVRDLIAAAQKNSLELTARDSAIEIDIDTRKDTAPVSRHSIDMRLRENAGENFFRHTACVSFRRNSVLL
jgi:hypothetical protein